MTKETSASERAQQWCYCRCDDTVLARGKIKWITEGRATQTSHWVAEHTENSEELFDSRAPVCVCVCQKINAGMFCRTLGQNQLIQTAGCKAPFDIGPVINIRRVLIQQADRKRWNMKSFRY